jgi:hypothetical protein
MPTLALIAGATLDGTQVASVNTPINDNEVVEFNQLTGLPTGVTSQLFNVAFTLANLKAVWISTDQPVNLFTNATDGSGGQHFSLGTGDWLAWKAGGQIANPFTVPVTAMYLNNASGFTANLKMVFIIHSGA